MSCVRWFWETLLDSDGSTCHRRGHLIGFPSYLYISSAVLSSTTSRPTPSHLVRIRQLQWRFLHRPATTSRNVTATRRGHKVSFQVGIKSHSAAENEALPASSMHSPGWMEMFMILSLWPRLGLARAPCVSVLAPSGWCVMENYTFSTFKCSSPFFPRLLPLCHYIHSTADSILCAHLASHFYCSSRLNRGCWFFGSRVHFFCPVTESAKYCLHFEEKRFRLLPTLSHAGFTSWCGFEWWLDPCAGFGPN